METENKILKNTFYYTLSSIIVMIISFFSLTLFTYILSTEEYGIVNFFTSSVNILTVILSLSLTTAASRFYYDKAINYKSFVKTTIFFIIIYNFFAFLIMLAFKSQIASYFNISSILVILIFIGTFLNIFIEYYSNYLTAIQSAKKYLFIKNLPLLANTLATIIFVLICQDLNGGYIRILCILFFNFILILLLLIKNRKIFKEKFDKNILKEVLKYSAPIVIHLLSNHLLTYFDKIVINQYIGMSSMGVYSFATRIAEILLLFINSINLSWAPVFYLNNGDYSKVKDLLKKYFQLIIVIFLGIVFFSESFAKIIISAEYHDGLVLIPIISFGYIFVFLYQIYINYSLHRKKTLNVTINTILSALLNLILNIIFIPKYGYVAAAISTVVSYLFLFILHYFNSKFILKGKVFKLKTLKLDFLILFIGIIIYLITKIYIKNILILLSIRVIYIIFIVHKYNILNTLKKILLNRIGDSKDEKK